MRERIIPGEPNHNKFESFTIPRNFSSQQCELTTYKAAISGPDRGCWMKAMKEEYDSLMQNKTWTLTHLPKGRKALKSKWVYKLKRNSNGSVQRYKARLVIKGYSQVAGVDYNETYSPVVRYASVRYLMSLAVQNNLKITQMDAVTAFLQGELNEEEICTVC